MYKSKGVALPQVNGIARLYLVTVPGMGNVANADLCCVGKEAGTLAFHQECFIFLVYL